MQIYLVQVDYSKDFSKDVVPIGLLHVGSALVNSGYKVKILHCSELEIDYYANEIAKDNPLWVGFSVMTGPQTMHSTWMSRKIKKIRNIPIVWGGIHPSILTDQCMNEDYIDYVITGEGEDTAVELTQSILSKKEKKGILGLAYREKLKVGSRMCVNNKRPFISNLDEEKYKLCFELLNIQKYFSKANAEKYSRVFSYKTSRGCPYKCGFCYNNNFNDRRWRAKSAQGVIKDILYLKEVYKIDGIKFYDDNFYVDKKRAFEILEGIGIPAKTDIRIDMVDDELAQKMKKFNVFDVLIGIESGSDRMLDLINKGFNVDKIKKGVEILAKNEIRVGYSAIIGIPSETQDEINSTIDLLLWINKIHKSKTITVGPYIPYPGSALYQWTINQGFSPPKTTEGWGMLERWSKDLHLFLPWIKNDYIYFIREYMRFFNYNVKLLSRVAELRIKYKFVKCPIDIYIMNVLYEYALKPGSIISRVIRGIHKIFKMK